MNVFFMQARSETQSWEKNHRHEPALHPALQYCS
jgi:hypothetical protein